MGRHRETYVLPGKHRRHLSGPGDIDPAALRIMDMDHGWRRE
jgi:hypothetical protein